ncbi:hypothetical protein ZWY2020_015827 [Hordeum vulgare]|nr:hypothetical protein ZWY2020_015827 [Hordeum vulgare]
MTGFSSQCYEAQARLHDPAYGCVAHIFALRQQAVNLQAQLESLNLKAQARPAELCPSVKSESGSYFGNDLMTCTLMQSSQDYNIPHVYAPDYTDAFNDEGIHSSTMLPVDIQEYLQENGNYWH